jgi:hypothetical protein
VKVASRAVVVLRCAFCRGALDDGEETLTCPDCATLVHDACQLELPACPTLGCGSLAPWEVAHKPVVAVRSARWGRGVRAAVVVAGLVCALVAGPAPDAAAKAPRAAIAPELSAWARVGANSVIVTRTEQRAPWRTWYSHCGCPPNCTDGPERTWVVGRDDYPTDQHYRVRWVLDEGVDVEHYTHDPAEPTRPAPRRSYFTAPTYERSPAPGGAFELVTVPAGTFPAAYRRAGELGTDRETALVETWTASWCPVPLKTVRSWVAPGGPAEVPTTETTVLVRFEPGAAR